MLVATSNENKTVYGFEQFLLVRKGLQPLTIISYLGSAKKFIESIGTNYPTHHQVEEYVARYFRGGYSYSHITNTSLALERWMEYIQDPIRLGRQKKTKTIIKDTLTEAEVTKLIFNCDGTKSKLIKSNFTYLYDINCEYVRVEFTNLEDFSTKISNIFKSLLSLNSFKTLSTNAGPEATQSCWFVIFSLRQEDCAKPPEIG